MYEVIEKQLGNSVEIRHFVLINYARDLEIDSESAGTMTRGFLANHTKKLRAELVLKPDGSFDYELALPIEEDDFATNESWWYQAYERAAAYYFIEFLRLLKNRKLVHQCDECGDFFIAKTTRAQRFCPDPKKCKDNWHYRKRKESGYLREYKKSRRAEGLDQ